MNRMPSVVSIVSRVFSCPPLYRLTVSLHVFLDSPELGPGSILDASGVTITPTSSLTLGASSLTVAPTSSLIFSASSVTITSTSSSILGPSGVSVTHASPFPSASSTGLPTPPPSRDSSSNTPAIAGGIAGGMLAISIAGVAIIYLRRRSKVLRQVLSAVYEGVGASQPRTTGLYVRGFVPLITHVSSFAAPFSVHPGPG